ncbi:iron-sulfur cluster biosynthesis family protein [Listeria ivanovii]|uniref:iron-sulfur cluster biosynthesis family protein n=1 Tax=Listeria ivanovii TaxID=1638 RepID=UPI00065E97F8|nr:iron-sulfur cluster biosynthesis family protein [Listeria ivanovii]
MFITFTNSAKERLNALRAGLSGQLHLYYDMEGCSCENSGIFTLRLVEERTKEDDEIESNIGPILIKRWTEMFLEDELTIDYDDIEKTMMLKSAGQYYNRNLLLVTDEDEVISCPIGAK